MNFESLDYKTARSIVQEVLNAKEGVNLIPYQGSSTYKPDLWQGYPGTSRKVVCEIKEGTITDFNLFNSAFHQSQALINEYNPDLFILVALRSLSMADKNRLMQQFGSRSNIKIYDSSDIDSFLKEFPQIQQKYLLDKVDWYIAFRKLAFELLAFYEKNPDGTSEKLFELCNKNKDFKTFNFRLAKLGDDFNMPSIDPIQIFASLNESNLWDARRTERLNNFFRILKSDINYGQIEYKGCPSPFGIKIMSARPADVQAKIWEMFKSILTNGQNGLSADHFLQIKKWYGVQISSLTIFLFWIDSENFLPIDKNTSKLLVELDLTKGRLQKFDEYKSLLTKKNSDLYRNVALFSYSQSTKPVTREDFFENDLKSVANIDSKNTTKEKSKEINEDISNTQPLNFKLLAVCGYSTKENDRIKVLKDGEIYSFYRCFNFVSIEKIRYLKELDFDLFNIREYKDEILTNELDINVSAVVGKNGSGKSTLTELLYLAINNLTSKILEDDCELDYEYGYHVDIFYYTNTVYRLNINDDIVTLIAYKKNNDCFVPDKEMLLEKATLSQFFYTIAVNYSHFALNSKEIGPWIKHVFHKNDGYQAPIVINPMRTEGNININLENVFVKQRLLANILAPIGSVEPEKSLRLLTENGRCAHSLTLYLDETKTDYIYKDMSGIYHYPNKEEIDDLMNIVFSYFHISINNSNKITEVAIKYIYKKLVTIAKNYKRYNKYFKEGDVKKEFIDEYLRKLDKDSSHITNKLKQAINFLKYKHLKFRETEKPISIEDLSNSIQEAMSENNGERELRVIELIPPSFFKIKITLSDGTNFDELSSGEKQRIHTVNSLIYHLTNLDSVDDSVDENGNYDLKYEFVNVIFDEAELYFHPDMQRTFVDYLKNYLRRVHLVDIRGINVCFVTHSPFILSDIPNNNIVFLDKEIDQTNITKSKAIQVDGKNIKTFGANVNELLNKGFFFNNGYMGDFARFRIKSAMNYLQQEIVNKDSNKSISGQTIKNWKGDLRTEENWNKEKLKSFIDLIGEPLIRNSLLDLHQQAYLSDREIEIEIERLQTLKAIRKNNSK